MKNRIFVLLIMIFAFITHSCENFDADLQDNPNFPPADQGELDAIFNNIQLDFETAHFVLEDQTGEVTRMYNALSQNYGNATLPVVFDGFWDAVYSGMLPDIELLRPIAELAGANVHLGAALTMKAFILMEMVDVFGDIPYSEVGQGTDNLSPKLDPGSDIYSIANGLLDEAIILLEEPASVRPAYDNFYSGDSNKWITLAKTIKLRAAYLTENISEFERIVNEDDIIDQESEDFQFNYGNNILNPDTRHPRYANMYDAADGDYMSNYYMWLLRADKTNSAGVEIIDPRIRYYFYRKVANSDRQPTDSYGCLLSDLPDQNERPDEWETIAMDSRLPYCYAYADGYTGRDHLNGSGIPADGGIRTAYGLYPMGGEFDANDFTNIQNNGTDGARGAGIMPLILSSYVDFMRADVALTSTVGNPKDLLLSGVEKSLNKVRSFETRDADKFADEITSYGETNTIGGLFSMTDDDITSYKNVVDSLYQNAINPRDVIIKEYYIAAWGNGLEAYNMYRKTGLPANMKPPLQPESAGDFPRSMRYANAFVDRNSGVSQKEESVLVFWDPGTSNVY